MMKIDIDFKYYNNEFLFFKNKLWDKKKRDFFFSEYLNQQVVRPYILLNNVDGIPAKKIAGDFYYYMHVSYFLLFLLSFVIIYFNFLIGFVYFLFIFILFYITSNFKIYSDLYLWFFKMELTKIFEDRYYLLEFVELLFYKKSSFNKKFMKVLQFYNTKSSKTFREKIEELRILTGNIHFTSSVIHSSNFKKEIQYELDQAFLELEETVKEKETSRGKNNVNLTAIFFTLPILFYFIAKMFRDVFSKTTDITNISLVDLDPTWSYPMLGIAIFLIYMNRRKD